MDREVKELIFADLMFMLLLSVSSMIPGALSDLLYAVAFIIPIIILSLLLKKGDRELYPISLSIRGRDIKETAVFILPTVLLVMLVSFLTGLLMWGLGFENRGADLSGNLAYVIVFYALAPAILEEILFRYFPLRLLSQHSIKCAVIYSSLMFSLAHSNLFQIPYAFIAGVLFAMLDIRAGSIVPSLIIHFINNLLSILFERGDFNSPLMLIALVVISVLSLASIARIIYKRKEIKESFLPIVSDKSKLILTYPLQIYMFATLLLAILSLLL